MKNKNSEKQETFAKQKNGHGGRNRGRRSIQHLCANGVIAALYVALTMLSMAAGLDSGVIQLRLGEILCILPLFIPSSVAGLTAGCLLSNFLCAALWQDLVFGTLATLLGALLCAALGFFYRRGCRFLFWLSPLPNVLANSLLIPFVLAYAYGAEGSIPFFMVTVGAGELLAGGMSIALFYALRKRMPNFLSRF